MLQQTPKLHLPKIGFLAAAPRLAPPPRWVVLLLVALLVEPPRFRYCPGWDGGFLSYVVGSVFFFGRDVFFLGTISHGNPQPPVWGVVTHNFWGLKPSFFMVLGSSLSHFIICCWLLWFPEWATITIAMNTVDGFIGFCWNPSDGCIFLGGSEKLKQNVFFCWIFFRRHKRHLFYKNWWLEDKHFLLGYVQLLC